MMRLDTLHDGSIVDMSESIRDTTNNRVHLGPLAPVMRRGPRGHDVDSVEFEVV